MKIGLVLSSTPGYSETFFNSKIEGGRRSYAGRRERWEEGWWLYLLLLLYFLFFLFFRSLLTRSRLLFNYIARVKSEG